MAVRALLMGRPGFYRLRLRWSPYADACHSVEWGADAPDEDDAQTLGRFCGYSADAIARYGT